MRSALLVTFLLLTAGVSTATAASKVRITEVKIVDDGSFANGGPIPQVDVVQDVCSVEETTTNYEPFFDTVASIKIVNRGTSTIRFNSFSYRLSLDGETFSSTKLPPSAGIEVRAGKAGSAVLSLFLQASNGSKFFTGSNSAISASSEPKAITFILEGRDGKGKRVRALATTTVLFSNYDRC